MNEFDRNIGFEKNANFFVESWQKSQKIVILTSTPAIKLKGLNCPAGLDTVCAATVSPLICRSHCDAVVTPS
jgi:hypothetical protein